MAFLRARDEEDLQFQMAPMIDCVFLLLLYFLITSTFINPESQLATDLPQKKQIENPIEQPQQFQVMVTKDGIEVNKRKMTIAAFRLQLLSYIGREETYVFVDSKDDALHENVVAILDMATDIGAKVTVVPPYEEKTE